MPNFVSRYIASISLLEFPTENLTRTRDFAARGFAATRGGFAQAAVRGFAATRASRRAWLCRDTRTRAHGCGHVPTTINIEMVRRTITNIVSFVSQYHFMKSTTIAVYTVYSIVSIMP